MTKADILRKEGLTEAEFYKLYPTEESYLMKCGGEMKAQLGQQIPKPFDYGMALLMQTGGNIVPDGLQEHVTPHTSPTKNTIPGQAPDDFLGERRTKLVEFLSKTAKPIHQQNIIQAAQDKFTSQFTPQGMPKAQTGIAMRRESLGACPQGHIWNGTTCVSIQEQEVDFPQLNPTSMMDWTEENKLQTFPINTIPPSTQQPQVSYPNTSDPYMGQLPVTPASSPRINGRPDYSNFPHLDPITAQITEYNGGGYNSAVLPGDMGRDGQTKTKDGNYGTNSSSDNSKSKNSNSNFDWMGLVNMINTGVLNMATIGEQRKEDAWKKAHRPKPEDWSAIYQSNRGNYSYGARFSGSNFRPNQTQYGMYGPIAQLGGQYELDQEVDMSPEEIQQFLANGGEIEYLL